MTSPIAAAIPPSVIRLKLWPNSLIARIVISTVIGMTAVATNVMPASQRNRKRIATARISPKTIASHTLWTESPHQQRLIVKQ